MWSRISSLLPSSNAYRRLPRWNTSPGTTDSDGSFSSGSSPTTSREYSPQWSKEASFEDDDVFEDDYLDNQSRLLSININSIRSSASSRSSSTWSVTMPFLSSYNTATSYANASFQKRGELFGHRVRRFGNKCSKYLSMLPVKVAMGRMTRRMFVLLLVAVTIIVTVVVLGKREIRIDESPGRYRDWENYPWVGGYDSGLGRLVPHHKNAFDYPPVHPHSPEHEKLVHTDSSMEEPEEKKPKGEPSQEDPQGTAWEDPKYLKPISQPYNPYPDFGEGYVECDYNDDDTNGGRVGKKRPRPQVRVFPGIPEGAPDPIIGSHQLLSLEDEVCFDRYGRLGPYGLGYSTDEGGLGIGLGAFHTEGGEGGFGPGTMPMQKIDWRGVDWGILQKKCYHKNKARFEEHKKENRISKRDYERKKQRKEKPKRTVILLRTWDDYDYRTTDILNIRALVSELAINTGGLFTVRLFVHVKNPNIPIWSDQQTYDEHLRRSVPQEFWNMSSLWNEPLMSLVYTDIPENQFGGLSLHGVYRSSFMPVQWFAQNHPEYDFFWNWEMDVRYTGHFYDLLSKIPEWAKKQPRKYLWERNARYYIPPVHGSWANFSEMVEKQVPIEKTVWGPVPVAGVVVQPDDPVPPFKTPAEDVDSTWGVGEEADLLSMGPLFDAEGTEWALADDTSGYGYPKSFSDRHGPPRRAAVVAFFRISRRLIDLMHNENAHHQHSACTEMWPGTVALQHGLKAVYIPHPLYIDRKWPLDRLAQVFNNGVGGATGGRKESIFGPREHNFNGVTWYYNDAFAERWYKMWVLGRGNAVGGEGDRSEARLGRTCIRGALVHPIKKVEEKH